MLTVQKFGGSSLADAEGLCRAAALCIRERQKGRDAVMVVSAMGETTDELLAMAYSVSPAPSARELDALMSTGECSSAALAAIALEAQGQRAVSLSGWQSGIFTDSVHGDAQITTLTAARVRAALAHGIVPVITGFQGIDNSGDGSAPKIVPGPHTRLPQKSLFFCFSPDRAASYTRGAACV